MFDKRRETQCARSIRAFAWISIIVVLGTSLSLPIMDPARGEIPTVHDSTEPEVTDWALVGYRPYIEDDPLAMNRAYLALFCREVGTNQYQFRFKWHDSTYVEVTDGEEFYDIEQYFFMGMVYRDAGSGNDPVVLWDGGLHKNTMGGEYTTAVSPTIMISDWTNIRFAGALMVHATVDPTYLERIGGYVLGLTVAIITGVAWTHGPLVGLVATAAGAVALGWYAEECLQDDDVNIFYHAFHGGLDLLNDPGACVQVQIDAEDGYDLPDELEAHPINRKYSGTFDLTVQCAFPSKLSLDLFMLSQDPVTGEYIDQALSRVDCNSQGVPRIVVTDFPGSRISLPMESSEQRVMNVEWDISDHFFSYEGFHQSDLQGYLRSGRYVPLDEQFSYLRSMGVDRWDIPTLQFRITITIDYELPGPTVSSYPAEPLHFIFERQRVVTALDYYTLGHLISTEKIIRDNRSDYRVFLGDETIMMGAGVPFIPLVIADELVREGGILLDMPDGLLDIAILPPWTSQVIGELTSDEDPDRRIGIADPRFITKETIGNFQNAIEQSSPIRSIRVVDPRRTIFAILDQELNPESLKFDPPEFAIHGYSQEIDETVSSWESFGIDTTDLSRELTAEEIEGRRKIAIRAIPGTPDEDVTWINITDPESNYQIGIELPDGSIHHLLDVLAPKEHEHGSVMINDMPAFVLVPGTADSDDVSTGFVDELPGNHHVGEGGSTVSVAPGTLPGTTILMNTLQCPEDNVVFNILDQGDLPDGGTTCTVISIVDPEQGSPVRSFVDIPISISGELHVQEQFLTIDPLCYDISSDREIALVTSSCATHEDGLLVRGVCEIPSRAPMNEIRSWIVTQDMYSFDSMRTREHSGNQILSQHEIPPMIEGPNVRHLIQHPGPDGEFYSFGSMELDGGHMVNFGVESFILEARTLSDDLFHLAEFTIENVVVTVSTEEMVDGTLILSGTCNRRDGAELVITMTDQYGGIFDFTARTLFGHYELVLEPGALQGGLYQCEITDDAGNGSSTIIEVMNHVS